MTADPSDEESQETAPPRALTPTEIGRNQNKMAAADYICHYLKWSPTLYLLLTGLAIPLPSPREGFRAPLEALGFLTSTESFEYKQCVVDGFDNVHDRMERVVVEERNRIQEKQEMNQKSVDQAMMLATTCSSSSESAREALRIWQRPVPVYNDTDMCSTLDQQELDNLIGQGLLHHERIVGPFEAYRDIVEESSKRLSEYVASRAQYDYDYFVGYKIEGIRVILDGITVDDLGLSFDLQGILGDLELNLQPIIDLVESLQFQVQILNTRLLDFQASINGFYAAYIDIYARLGRITAFTADFVPPGFQLPADFDLSGVPVPDLLLPVNLDIPTFDIDTKIDDLIAEYLRKAVLLLIDAAEQAGREAKEALEELLERLREALALEDYNPPRFAGSRPGIETVSEENDYLSQLGFVTNQQLLEVLGQMQLVADSAIEMPSLPNDNFSTTGFDSNTTSFEYESPIFPTFDIPDWIENFYHFVYVYRWVFEGLIALLRGLMTVRRHRRNALPDLPVIGYENNEDHAPNQSRLARVRLILRAVLGPWTFAAIVFFVMIYLAASLYVPHVKSRCVNSLDGTFLGTNLVAPIEINKASFAGNTAHIAAELQCSQRQRSVCNRMYADSDLVYREHLASLAASQSLYNVSVDATSLMSRCVEVQSVDSFFQIDCCGLEGYGTLCLESAEPALCPIDNATFPASSFRPLSDYLDNTNCDGSFDSIQLEDAHFDCAVLQEACSATPCSGVDTELLRAMSVEADCKVEVYLIMSGLSIVFLLWCIIFVWLGCTSLYRGALRLLWRSLRLDGINLRTQMTEEGDLLQGQDKQERRARISAALRGYKTVGRMYVILSALVFILVMISVLLVRYYILDDYISVLQH